MFTRSIFFSCLFECLVCPQKPQKNQTKNHNFPRFALADADNLQKTNQTRLLVKQHYSDTWVLFTGGLLVAAAVVVKVVEQRGGGDFALCPVRGVFCFGFGFLCNSHCVEILTERESPSSRYIYINAYRVSVHFFIIQYCVLIIM